MRGRDTYILGGLIVVCSVVVIAAEVLMGAGGATTDAEVYRSIAGELATKNLHAQAIGYYDRYLEAARPAPEKAANIHYAVGKMYQDELANFEEALSRYVAAKNLHDKAPYERELNSRMVQCLERLERSLDAKNLLRESTALKADRRKSVPADKVIATVGERQYSIADFEAEWQKLPPMVRQQMTDPQRKFEVFRQIIARDVLAEAAERKGLAKDPEVQRRLEEMRSDIIVQTLLEQEVESKVAPTEQDLRLFHEARSERYIMPRQVEIAHIQLDTREEAEEVLDDLRDGADFAATAREESEDAATADKGGYIGFVTEEGPIPGLGAFPSINRAAFDVRVGQYSFVVETDLGYHILHIMSERPRDVAPFDQVRDQVRQDFIAERSQEVQQELFQRYLEGDDVAINETAFYRQLGATPPDGGGSQ